jgi:hypothetical protein
VGMPAGLQAPSSAAGLTQCLVLGCRAPYGLLEWQDAIQHAGSIFNFSSIARAIAKQVRVGQQPPVPSQLNTNPAVKPIQACICTSSAECSGWYNACCSGAHAHCQLLCVCADRGWSHASGQSYGPSCWMCSHQSPAASSASTST